MSIYVSSTKQMYLQSLHHEVQNLLNNQIKNWVFFKIFILFFFCVFVSQLLIDISVVTRPQQTFHLALFMYTHFFLMSSRLVFWVIFVFMLHSLTLIHVVYSNYLDQM